MRFRLCLCVSIASTVALAAPKPKPTIAYPPRLPQNAAVVTDTSPVFLKPTTPLRDGVTIARTAPTIDFAYFPGQTYAGHPWSNWGDSLAVNGKYYASIGDHLAPAGNAFVYEYDPQKQSFRQLLDLKKLLALPEGHYVPGKIHSRLDLGDDGWLYCSTHRGSTKVTTDAYHYTGDWIVRVNPTTGASEVVARAPVPKHCIPTSVFDPKRLIFYGGTAPGSGDPNNIHFFAYDVQNRKILYDDPHGPARCMIFAPSTGRVYFIPGKDSLGQLVRFDPKKPGAVEKLSTTIGLRAATTETPTRRVYTVSSGQGGQDAELYVFDTETETATKIGSAAVGKNQYIATLDADHTGRFLYYIPGAHGGAEVDGTPVVQYDTRTKTRKVLAFLHPFYQEKYGCTLRGTYSVALDETGERLYVTWNANRGSRAWDTAALTVIHIPSSER